MSENTVLLLPHQERFLQSRHNFPDIRWHFLLAGYGAGKSRSLAISALEIISELDGEKDDGGLYAKIIIGGYTHAHLEQTLMIDFRAYLDASKTPYHEDTKNHIITIGTVQVIFVQLLEPGKIFGQSVYCALLDECLIGQTKVLTKQMTEGIVYKKLKDISVGDLVLTRYGWRQVVRTKNQGRRKVIARNGLIGTPDHCVAAVGGYTELQDTKGKQLYVVSKRMVKLWQKTSLALSDLEKLSNLTEGSITGILLHDTDGRENILSALQTVNRYMKLCGKKQMDLNLQDVKYTIKMVTLSITLLKTLSALQKKNTCKSTLSWGLARTTAMATIRSYVIYAERLLKDIMEQHLTECAQNSVLLEQDLLRCVSLSLSAQAALTESSREMEVTFAKTVGSLLFRVEQIVSSVVKNAETLMLGNTDLPQSNAKNLTPLPVPFVARRSRLAIRVLDAVRNLVLIISGGTRTVYDITVNDCHEFSTSCCFVKNCDELPEDTMIEAMKSVSQRVRQVMPNHRSPFIMAASTAQGMKGFYRLYCHYKKSGIGFVLTRARTQDNWYLPKEYILDLWKNFNETERKVYMEGAFLSVMQGRVIPGFDWDKNFAPESDLDKELYAHERVYIGQDFNCGIGSTLVITSHGEVQLKDIKVGDYVLTRKGFKKVLTTACRGVKVVYDFGKLGFTKDHVAITPQGDKQLWEAQNFYCLKEQSISEYRKLGTMWETLNELKQYFMTATCGGDVPIVPMMHSENTLQATRQCCTGTSIRSFMEKYLKGITSITRMGTMITDLKLLSACQSQNMQNFITICQETISESLCGKTRQKRYSLGISQKKVKHTIQKYLRKLGLQERSTVNVLASIAAEYFQLKSERLNVALSAGLDIASREKLTAINEVRQEIAETLTLSLKELVLFAERRLQELLQRNTAKNISIIGSVPATNEREAEVYDIEVEDAHEFFANGILVHNCGYNRGSAWVARNGILHCIKRYDFPDTDDIADIYRYDFPEQDIFWLPDVTIKDQYPHFARSLRKNDIHIIHRSKSPLVEDSCFLISKLCTQGRIMIHSQAREIAEAFSTASRGKDNKIPKGVGPNSPIHDIDGARYVCSYLALVLPEFRDVRRGIMSHLASFRAGAGEMEERLSAVGDIGAGYTRIEGRAFT